MNTHTYAGWGQHGRRCFWSQTGSCSAITSSFCAGMKGYCCTCSDFFFFLSRKIRIFFQDFVFLENQYYQRLYTIKEINLQYEFKYVYPLILFLFIMLLLSYLEKLCYRQDTFWKLKTENQNLKLSKLKLKLQNQSSWVQILILSFPFSIILNKLHNLCVLYAFSNEILI